MVCLFSFPSSISEWSDDNDTSPGRKVHRFVLLTRKNPSDLTNNDNSTHMRNLVPLMPMMSLSNKLLLRLLLSSPDVQPRFVLAYLRNKFPDSHILSNETFVSEGTLKSNSGAAEGTSYLEILWPSGCVLMNSCEWVPSDMSFE